MYAICRLGSVKLSFLVDMGCKHNLLSKATFDCLPAVVKERLEPWDTATMLATVSRLLVHGKIKDLPLRDGIPGTSCFIVDRSIDQQL